MINMLHYEMANMIFSWLTLFITAFFFYRFCHIFIPHTSIVFIAVGYFSALFMLGQLMPALPNFYLYLLASAIAFLLLLPLRAYSIYIKLFVTVTYFSIRWIALTVIMMLNRPLSNLSLFTAEKWLIPKIDDVTIGYFIYTIWIILLLLILCVAGLSAVVTIYEKCYRKHPRIWTRREIALLLLPSLIGLSSYFMMNMYHKALGDQPTPDVLERFLLFWAIHNSIVLGANFTVLILLQRLDLQRVEQQKQLILLQQTEQLQNHLQTVDALYKEMQQLKHDVKNHSATVESLIDSNHMTEASLYLHRMQQQMDATLEKTDSGHTIIDVLLHEKMEQAFAQRVTIESSFIYPIHVQCDVYDLCIILHNALDNALVATKTLPNSVIHVQTKQHKSTFMLTIMNPFSPAFTTKAGSGLGLSIIQDVAHKYNGDIQIHKENDVFTLHVMLHFQPQKVATLYAQA